jgi:adenosylhomocysteinase
MDDLLQKGILRLDWAKEHMGVLAQVRSEMVKDKSLKGKRVGMALHVEAKTGILALALKEAGATVRLTSCNPLSTDDCVAVALNKHHKLETYAKKWQTNEAYYESLQKVLDMKPHIVVDDGGDLIFLLHTERKELLDGIIGANEETTTGIIRLKAMAKEGALKFPVMAVNNAKMKHLFDNRYGTGQSTFDGILNATNLLIAGKRFVVAGYGWCGRGIAMRARGMGAIVTVCEVDPVSAIEAHLDGFDVMPMAQAIAGADFLVTVTGCKDIVTAEHLKLAKDGIVMANSGHFDNEVSKIDLKKLSKSVRRVREFVDEYKFKDGKRVYLLAEGRLVNLAAGQGHPVEIMDMSFAIQALCAQHLAVNGKKMKPGVYDVPKDMDDRVAELALKTSGIKLDSLSKNQKAYLGSWREGT